MRVKCSQLDKPVVLKVLEVDYSMIEFVDKSDFKSRSDQKLLFGAVNITRTDSGSDRIAFGIGSDRTGIFAFGAKLLF